MEVGWSLKGAVLHNVSVALCVSPSVHTDLNTMERCEAALCGFILQDLWKLVSDQTQQELQVATGSTWLAGQTMANLQGCALSTVALCVGKSSTWLPWRFGRGRLSEISIEEHFGHLRCQTRSSPHDHSSMQMLARACEPSRTLPKLLHDAPLLVLKSQLWLTASFVVLDGKGWQRFVHVCFGLASVVYLCLTRMSPMNQAVCIYKMWSFYMLLQNDVMSIQLSI